MWRKILLLFQTSVIFSHIADTLDVTLADEDNRPNNSFDVTLAGDHTSSLLLTLSEEKKSPNNLLDVTLAGEENPPRHLFDVTSLAIEKNEEKIDRDGKSLLLWRLINIAAGSFLVLVFMNMVAMLSILLGWNLLA